MKRFPSINITIIGNGAFAEGEYTRKARAKRIRKVLVGREISKTRLNIGYGNPIQGGVKYIQIRIDSL